MASETSGSKITKLESAETAAIGEHYVLARLTALGFIVGLPPKNMRTVDLIAAPRDGNGSLLIQVKTRTKGRSSDEGWHMQEKHEQIIEDRLFYIFVTLPSKWSDSMQPETFVIPSKKVASILKISYQEWLRTPGKKGQKHNDTKMRRILPIYKGSLEIPTNWMEEFRDNWALLNSFNDRNITNY